MTSAVTTRSSIPAAVLKTGKNRKNGPLPGKKPAFSGFSEWKWQMLTPVHFLQCQDHPRAPRGGRSGTASASEFMLHGAETSL
ncbi:MAG: hypothetical protein V4578_26630 [Pseudomonadota bacterium]